VEKDWYDILKTSGYGKYPYQIQWCLRSGNVRAKRDTDKHWIVKDCCVNAKSAESIGYRLLRGET
jgi:hypothetical protein